MSETTLYRLFDQDGELLYVGISGRWVRRLASHAARQGWWDDVASVTRQPFPSRSEALVLQPEFVTWRVRGGQGR
jgi:predicted GIY-YIG superfamily endonuclease